MAIARSARVHLINSIRVDPTRAESYAELEDDVRKQLAASVRRFEKLKTTIMHLVRFTTDIRGVIDVDLLEKKAGRIRPNMDVVRSLRLIKYILSTLIYLVRGDESYMEDLKPGEAFFQKRPHLAEAVKTRADVDTVLLALYNESPRKFVADEEPRYEIRALLRQILAARSRRRSMPESRFFHAHARQFEEGMYQLTGAVLRLLFNVEEADTDLDIMLYLVRSGGVKPVRLKRVFTDDVRGVHRKIDHVLFLLKEAARYVLEETQKDASFIQQILSTTYVGGVREASWGVLKDLHGLEAVLEGMSTRRTRMRLCWLVRDRTAAPTDRLNRMMNTEVYRDLLLLSRDMKECGAEFFSLLQNVYGFYAGLATRNQVGLTDLLERLEGILRSHFAAITSFLDLAPAVDRRLATFRKSYGSFTLIEEGRSELNKTIVHEVSQVYVNFTTSTERGKQFRHRLKEYEEFDLLYDGLYGDRIKAITDPIIRMADTFPAQSRFNLGRYVGRGVVDPDAMRSSYRRVMRIRCFADAILDFHGNLRDDGRYTFEPAALREECVQARRHLAAIQDYCRDYVAAHKPVGEAGEGAQSAPPHGAASDRSGGARDP